MSKIKSVVLVATLVAAAGSARADVTGSVEATPAKFLKDTIVYVKAVPNQKATPTTVEIDQKGMEFTPHIALLMVGDSIRFHNNDKVDHNVMSPEGGYDLGTWGTGKTKDQVFKKEGVFSQVCKLHPEMLAYVFVGQNRFSATVGADGKFSIAGLPAGTYELDVWNPKLKAPAQKITVGADGKATAHFAMTR
jgi:plastocyanin